MRLLAPTPAPIPIAEEVENILMGTMVDEDVGGVVEGEGLEVAAEVLDGFPFGARVDELVGAGVGKLVGRVSMESDEADVVVGGRGSVLIAL
jgi:hypothetical protein